MVTPANISPSMIDITFAMNIGFLLVSLFEKNSNRTKRGTSIADQMQVTISNWYIALTDVTTTAELCSDEPGGPIALVKAVEQSTCAMVPDNR
jgi:hypothetical protein